MSVSKFLSRLQRDDSGNVMMICAAMMPLLMGSAAMAIDATQIALWKRQLQRAADSAAIAGAYTLTQNGDSASINDAIFSDIDENPTPELFEEPSIAVGPSGAYNQSVTVGLLSRRTLPFANIFTKTPTTIKADATAALVGQGEYCMISLYDGGDTGIDINGNSTVTLGCGMITNSVSSNAVTAGGSSSVQATPIGAVGGLQGESQNFVGDTELLPYSAPQADPLAYLPDPVWTGCSGTLDVNNGQVVRINPATQCYTSINVGSGGTLQIEPGTLKVSGGDIDIHGTVHSVANAAGEIGNTIVMTGVNGQAGDLKINAQAEISLKSPTSGDFKGVSFFRDRRASNIEIKINGGASSVFEGAFYAPSSDLAFTGNSGMDVRCLQMIGQKLTFRGSASITNQCPAGSGGGALSRRVVRLIE